MLSTVFKLTLTIFLFHIGVIGLSIMAGMRLSSDQLAVSRWASSNLLDLYVIDVERDLSFRLTDTEGNNENFPRWSPDGQRILFMRTNDWGYREAFWITSGGRHETHAGLTDSMSGDWSPDGQTVVLEILEDAASNLYLQPVQGGPAIPLTDSRSQNTYPSWSPDGDWIAFTSNRWPNRQITLIPARGGDARLLLDGVSNSDYAAWSPDGQRLAFASFTNGAWTIFTVSASGDDLRQITEGSFPAWSPDGESIVYNVNNDLYIISAEGQNRRLLLENGWYVDWRP